MSFETLVNDFCFFHAEITNLLNSMTAETVCPDPITIKELRYF